MWLSLGSWVWEEMIIYGLDFTSAPKRQKPITCARCLLTNGLLCVQDFANFISFDQLEEFLQTSGPWIAGFDFPFGQPRKLIVNLGWPLSWDGYIKLVGNMTKEEFVQTLTQYRKQRPKGDKHHMRLIDKKARSCSPMMLYGVPVGKMFFEGAPILLRSGLCILPNHPMDCDRIIVEAFPALVARIFIGDRSYKNDTKSKQTVEQRDARIKITEGFCSDRLRQLYGFCVKLNNVTIEQCIEEPGADFLDSILCAIQAAWAYENRDKNYGIPADCDPLEGWIVDPAIARENSMKEEIQKKDKADIKRAYEKAKAEIEGIGGWEAFKSGEWFLRLIRRSFKNYFEKANAEFFHKKYPTLSTDSLVKKLIQVAARNSGLLGAIVGAAVSADEIAAIVTAGGGIGIPANIAIALTAIMGEAVLLVRMQLQLVANIAKLYDVPLDLDDPEDILTIMAFALGGSIAEMAGKAGMKIGKKVTEKGVRKYISKGVLKTIQRLGRKIGIKILQRTIIKYAVPIASIGVGSGWNYLATKAVGKISTKHFKGLSK